MMTPVETETDTPQDTVPATPEETPLRSTAPPRTSGATLIPPPIMREAIQKVTLKLIGFMVLVAALTVMIMLACGMFSVRKRQSRRPPPAPRIDSPLLATQDFF
jgi:hypothetical protein